MWLIQQLKYLLNMRHRYLLHQYLKSLSVFLSLTIFCQHQKKHNSNLCSTMLLCMRRSNWIYPCSLLSQVAGCTLSEVFWFTFTVAKYICSLLMHYKKHNWCCVKIFWPSIKFNFCLFLKDQHLLLWFHCWLIVNFLHNMRLD